MTVHFRSLTRPLPASASIAPPGPVKGAINALLCSLPGQRGCKYF